MTTPAAQREENVSRIKSNLFPSTKSSEDHDRRLQQICQRIPIIDSHIHLYPSSETHTLNWYTDDTAPELLGQHSLVEYLSDTDSSPELEGFIFLETDRVCNISIDENDNGSGWSGPLMEIDWLRRIALGEPRKGEGHEIWHAKFCLGIVPWAPLPSGASVLDRYIEKVREVAGSAFDKVCGFRYLVQAEDDGTMLGDDFVQGLKWLGRNGLVFDLGIDMHRRGIIQLDEAIQMISRAHEDVAANDRVVVVINHLCKPDLSIKDTTSDSDFVAWRAAISTLSLFPKTYMKLSGMFSELPPELQKAPKEEIFEAIMPWLIVILTAFRGRLMFGSDWPVCTAGVGHEAWFKWRWIVQRLCDLSDLSVEEQIMLWSGTAIEAYGLKSLI